MAKFFERGIPNNPWRTGGAVCNWKAAGDPAAAKRTWQNVMDEIPKLKTGGLPARWVTAIKDKAFDSVRTAAN